MNSISQSVFSLHYLEELSEKNTVIHSLNSGVKLAATVIYLAAMLSIGRYDISRLLPFVLYPVVVFSLGEIPVGKMFKRLIPVLPFVVAIGIFNPFLDRAAGAVVGGIIISRGWISFTTILIKCALAVISVLLLVATTGMDRIAGALRSAGAPKIMVTQLLLTYRYISVIADEGESMVRSYRLRCGTSRGIAIIHIGPMLGSLLLRALDRADRVYVAMKLRGFTGDELYCRKIPMDKASVMYLAVWMVFFAAARVFNIPQLLGNLMMGVIA
jgi:cobalt/nickel transport system permease protein